MSTTHFPPSDREHNAADDTNVVPLDALKRRRRLDHLLSTRHHLAVMAAQQRSHGLEEADESFGLQLAVESTLRDEYPDESERLFGTWLETDVAYEHPTGVLTAECGICRSIATAHGLNLVPPGAA